MRLLHRRLFVILRPDYALHRVFQNEVCNLITAYKRACERSAVDGNNEDFPYRRVRGSALPGECKPDPGKLR